jgi:hypothetical protein
MICFFLDPLRDANVIYTFHFYESHIFTHQGATWGESWWHFLRGVPYPSDPENVQSAANEIADPVHRLQVVRYGTDRWNATRIDKEITQAADWGWALGAFRSFAMSSECFGRMLTRRTARRGFRMCGRRLRSTGLDGRCGITTEDLEW